MGRKGGLASIFSSKQSKLAAAAGDAHYPSLPWPWPSCATKPQTPSFRRQGGGDDDRPCTTGAAGRPNGAAASVGSGSLRPPRKAAAAPGDEMYKTVNSVYFDAADSRRFFFFGDVGAGGDGEDDLELDLDDGSFSTTTASEEWSEAVIRSLGGRTSTDRFFFDAGTGAPAASNSILAASPSTSPSPGRTLLEPPPPPPAEQQPRPPKIRQAPSSSSTAGPGVLSESDDDGVSDAEPETELLPQLCTSSLVEESVAVALDSEDPFRDFRASMDEMVSAHGLRDWAALQEMLLWYLRINGKHNHALIVGAFVDLLVGLATSNGCSASATTTTTTATMTTTTTGCCSSSSSSTTSSSAGGGGTTTAAAASATTDEQGQCGGGGISAGASCSSASSSDLEDEAAADRRNIQ